ncbi:phosphate-starvation-inducible PsiE family protein [Acinetobacter baumannii]|nr:phosphate-starvation-inducible PsiE family protein [Acinetobacter baumannii]
MPDPKKFERTLDRFGHYAVEAFHYLALFIIGCMIAWSAAHTVFEILTIKKYASIDDILLLFIYLELGAMVGIYFKTNHMPVRFLISDIQHDHKADLDQVIITGSILILALSILVVRFASWHYPSVMKEKYSKTPTSLKTPQPQDDELA